jgi:hypothetical protein
MAGSYGSGRSSFSGSLVGVVVCAALAFGFFHFHVLERLGDLTGEALIGVVSLTGPFGDRLTVKGTDYRPALDVTAQRPERTRSVVRGMRATQGKILLAAPLTVHNNGDRVWDTAHTTTVTLIDSSGARHAWQPRFTKVRAGKVFPAVIKLQPGRTMRGVAVFEVPRDTRIASLEIKVGPGWARPATWQVTRPDA